MQHTETLIVGAGPAGLAVAGLLSQVKRPYLLLEKEDKLTPIWHNHYERLCLHTVKEHSDLPGMPMPAQYPTYVPRLDLIAYWEDYARKMNISPLFRQQVVKIKKEQDHWITQTIADTFQSKNVVVATGYNRAPYLPEWPGHEQYKGTFLHSHLYRSAKPFAGQKVLLIGMGNTGAELALDLYENGATPFVSIRGPVNFIRRDIAGRPTQKTAILLAKLPDPVADFIARLVQKLTVGDLTPYGVPASPYAPNEQMRRFGKVPVIDIGAIDLIKQRKVQILPGIERFNENSVSFTGGRTETFDTVIACTGYRARVEDFVQNARPLLNERGYPRQIWFDEKGLEGLYFCGFTEPVSGVLRNIKTDAEKIVKLIAS